MTRQSFILHELATFTHAQGSLRIRTNYQCDSYSRLPRQTDMGFSLMNMYIEVFATSENPYPIAHFT